MPHARPPAAPAVGAAASTGAVVLVCAPPGSPLPELLRQRGATVLVAERGLDDVVQSLQAQLDLVVVIAGLPGMSALSVCGALHLSPLVGATVPMLVLVEERPTPEERVAGVRAGVWEFVTYTGPVDVDELWLKIEAYARAKRRIDEAIAEGLADPNTGVLNGPGLVRRGRELVSLMARERAAVACVVFGVPRATGTNASGAVVARASRLSDIVGVLDADRLAVLAPATGGAGAVRLAERLGEALRRGARPSGEGVALQGLRAGYHVVSNVGYQPIDSLELLQRATVALERGVPDPVFPWVRRFDSA